MEGFAERMSPKPDLPNQQRYISPLRYPGGKACLAPFLAQVLRANSLLNCEYYEPFAGGAGAALSLLRDGHVSTLHLNDADARIYTFWSVLFKQNERFAETVFNSTASISEWRKHSMICANFKRHSAFDVAFATFFLNRVNRSGVIDGARPIGGLQQTGPFKMDARYNVATLARRIRDLARFREGIKLYNQDALIFFAKPPPERLP
jgi:DNA adenine methylase